MRDLEFDPVPPWAARLAKNESYFGSIKVLLKRVIFYGPSGWWFLAGSGIKAVAFIVPQILLMSLLWLCTTLFMVGAGLAGRLSEPMPHQPENDEPMPPTAGNGEGPQEGLGV